ncbi:hypothetical protein WR25_08249 [Diploscapter pachys]|uniref:RRM domain-containing protein n=1 Tax=Diploscapter pachys TaxID=2018661 RepID=A0A2A2LHM1_9BILA|nr:hypothetical protein WR25_08249 [Diploscapter pachys]
MADEEQLKLDDEELISNSGLSETIDEHDLSSIEAQMAELEEEQKKLKQIQSDLQGTMNMSSGSQSNLSVQSAEEKAEADSKSVYVGNVDYATTAEDLERHFHGCGSVQRVTILCDKFTGHPKGFAYVEFAEKEGMQNALAMTDSLLKGRQIKVMPKRTNKPGISTTNRPPRGMGGFRGRGAGGRGGVIIKYIYPGGFRGRPRGMRRPAFSPYM